MDNPQEELQRNVENFPQQLPPRKKWLPQHMILGYAFLLLVFAGAVWAGYSLKYGGQKGIIYDDGCEKIDVKNKIYENAAPAKIEKIGNTYSLTLECEDPKSIYVADSVTDLEPFVNQYVNVRYKIVEYLNKDIQCITTPCNPVTEIRASILEVSLADQVCIQMIQRARNPHTGEEKDFPTPCDVPEGWEKLGSEEVSEPIDTSNWQSWRTSLNHFVISIPPTWVVKQFDAGGASQVSIYLSTKNAQEDLSIIEIDIPEIRVRYSENTPEIQKIILEVERSIIKNPTQDQINNARIIP